MCGKERYNCSMIQCEASLEDFFVVGEKYHMWNVVLGGKELGLQPCLQKCGDGREIGCKTFIVYLYRNMKIEMMIFK
jgi:hypothetical protein